MDYITSGTDGFPVVRNIYTDIIHEGDIFKNYKHLCKFLNEETKTGDSRNAQHKEWSRYFEYEREGHKYIITEIYLEPLPKSDKRSVGNNSEYLPHIELILLDHLSKQHGKVASLTINNIFLLLGMVNKNYVDKNYKIEDNLIDKFYIDHFNQRSYRRLNRILFDALNNLKNRRLIDYQSVKMINVDEQINRREHNVIRPATPEECDIIRNIERDVLLDMGFESIVLVHLKFKTKEFYESVRNILKEQHGINFYYTQIDLRFTHEHIIQAKSDMETKILLNSKIIDGLNKEAESRLQKNFENYEKLRDEALNNDIGRPNSTKLSKIFRYDEEAYRYSQQQLAEYLLRIEDREVVKEQSIKGNPLLPF